MRSRRLTWFLLIVILLVVGVCLAFNRLLVAQGVTQLDWHMTRAGLVVDKLQVERAAADGSRLSLQGNAIELAWPRYQDGQPLLPSLAARTLTMNWQPPTEAGQDDAAPSDPQALLDNLRWIPLCVDIESLNLDLPCAAERCLLQGGLHLDQSAQPASLRVELHEGERLFVVQSTLQYRDEQWQLQADVSLDGKPQLTLSSQLQGDAWSGRLQLEQLSDTRGLFAWISQWQAADERLLHAEAAARLTANWQVQLVANDDPLSLQRVQDGSGRFDLDAYLQSPQLRQDDLTLKSLAANIKLDGQFAERRVQIKLLPGTSLAAGQLDVGKAITAQTVKIEPAGLELQAGDPQRPLLAQGPLSISVGTLQQANLHALGWRFKGTVEADLSRQSWRGKLSNDAELALDIDGVRTADGTVQLNAAMGELFFRAGNPLSKSFVDWPALLELANGRLQGKLALRLPPSAKALSADASLQFKGLDGIYDRSELRGVSGSANLALRDNQLNLELPDLAVQQANPGLPIGPLSFQGRYQTTLSAPLRGRVTWQQARTGLFGGEVWLAPGEVDLSRPAQRLPLQIKGLQLAEVLRVYPAEGLAGTGTIDGQLPLLVDASGVRVEQGRVAAQAPGVLQFRSEKIKALGRSNPGMKLVSDALDDFHYEVLDSAVSYDQNGKLTLGLRLQGRNPDLEKGRPINLNVNLEEDVPALLTSLQLTDKVSETIRQRVQERLRQRNSPAP
ncbi:intermembrane phospholipid transport protein YdbH family protein [Pseudomonas sp. LRF_L74]|uniref:YdbH domain-containing protein n=1 Tax=Pseudomonas sp. LRF_L74 TaxID=3369422 RepID=UPI003F601979